jgi:ADP-heptose:LPS heptosyltransferase
LKFDQSPETSGGDEVSLEAFWDLLSCDLNETLDYRILDCAAKALASHGQNDLAKAFWEVGFLSDETGRYRRQHLAAAQRFGLWPLAHLSELIQNQSEKAVGRSVESRRRLRVLAKAALSSEKRDDERPLARDDPLSPGVWPPAVLRVEEAVKLAPQTFASVERAYLSFFHVDAGVGRELIDAMRALALNASPWLNAVTFPRARSVGDFRLVAVRILQSQIGKWLVRGQSRYFGRYADPDVIGAFMMLRGNPLAERFAELRSASKVFFEVDTVLAGLASEAPSRDFDLAFACLVSVCLGGLTNEEAWSLFEESVGHNYFATSAVLIPRFLPDGATPDTVVTEIAQKIKTAGDARLALNLLEERLDEERASAPALIEKALLAKIVGNFAMAARLMERCAERDPNNLFLRRELVAILPEIEPLPSILSRFAADPLFMGAARERRLFRQALGEEPVDLAEAVVEDDIRAADLAPEIAAEFRPFVSGDSDCEAIAILAAGWRKGVGVGGSFARLRALDFVRVRVTSRTPIVNMRARIDGRTVGTAVPSLLSGDAPDAPTKTWICNCWMDLSQVPAGRHELQVYFEERGGGYRSEQEMVWVDPSGYSAEEKRSAAIMELPDETQDLPLEERINALPSLILPAERTLFEGPLKKILVVRADQLGDATLSLPAMFALKERFPDAELFCLAAPTNHDLLRSTGLFAQLFGIELPYDPRTRLRYASLADQAVLKKQLSRVEFDLAVDLSPGSVSRPLLRLANARYTAGYNPGEFRWLSFGLSLATRDPGNKREGSPHSVRPLALVDALASVVAHQGFRLPNAAVDVEFLKARNLDGGRGFAIVHCGARTPSRKWPAANFVALARRIASELNLRVVILTDSPADAEGVDVHTLDARQFEVIAERLPFSAFDTLLSKCAVFVGNDAGPKHLAALRGAPVVSLHMGAVNWREWGQEDSGVVVTRRVPCYGCGIEEIAECGKGLACLMNISVDEAFEGVRRAMHGAKARG